MTTPDTGADAEPSETGEPDTGPAATPDGEQALVRSSTVMAVGTVASRALGFARTAVIAAALGTRLTVDTFTVANTVPNILYILVAGGVLNAVFVPQLVRAMQGGEDAGRAYTDRLLTLAGLVLLGIAALATVAAPLIIGLYVADDWTRGDTAVAVAFAYWCLPQIVFYGVYTMLGQVLNARGSFGPMMWAPVANNVVAIVTGLVFIALFTVDAADPASLSTGAIAFLGAGTTLGVAMQALVLVPVLRRSGFRWRPRFDVRGVGLGRTAELARWTLLFVAVNQVAYVVVVNLTTAAAERAAGVLDYGVGIFPYSSAYLIFILPHSIITVSVVTGMLPGLSRDAAAGDRAQVRATLSYAWRLTGVGVVLATAAYLALAPDLTGVLFAANSVADARYIGLVTMAFALGLPFFSAQYVALRGFYAFEDTRTPFLLQVAIAGTNVALALLAYAVLPLAAATVGVAAAYAVTYALGLLLTTSVLRRRVGGLDGRRVLRTYVRLAVAALPAGGLAALAAWLVGRWLGDGLTGSLASLAAGGSLLLVVYLLAARALRVRELDTLLQTVRGRLRR